MKQILDHLWLNQQTKVRFVLVGIWNTIFGYLIFVGLDYLFNLIFSPRYVAYMSAAVFSNIIAVTNAYFFHKHLTFKSETRGMAAFHEYIRFYIAYLFMFVTSLILLPIFIEFLYLDPKIAAAVITLILTVVSYISHSHFSFHKTRQDSIQKQG